MKKTHLPKRHRQTQGLIAVPVVLILFLITGILFFYVNRDLIAEQRTSASQYRSTQAFEVAEAGMEWALTYLSWQQFIDTSCKPTTATKTFKQKYLTEGTLVPVYAGKQVAGCSMAADGAMTCSCPTAALTTLAGAGTNPYFTVEFEAIAGADVPPGTVAVVVRGCTPSSSDGLDPRCLKDGTGTSDAAAEIHAIFGIASALGGQPSSTITSKGAVTMKGAGSAVGIYNSDASVSGITIDSGGTVDPTNAKLVTVPGSDPKSSYIQNDPALSSITGDQMFQNYFNMTKADKKLNAYVIDCVTVYTSKSTCQNALETAVTNGKQDIWVEGDVEMKGNTNIGNSTAGSEFPVNLIVTGNASFGAGTTFYGFLYVMGQNTTCGGVTPCWDFQGGGNGLIRGSGATEGSFNTTNGTPDFYYDSTALKLLNQGTGTFVRIPGSWIDYKVN